MPLALSAAALGLAAFLAVLHFTAPHGPGMVIDSVAYVSAGESLARHGTLRIPLGRPWSNPDSTAVLAQWPPGMAIALALPVLGGMAPIAGARLALALLAALGVAGTVLLVGGAVSRRVSTRVAVIAGVTAALLAFLAPSIARLYLAVWSEPLYLLFLLALAWRMARAPDRALEHGIIAALAVMVRYAGIALGGAAVAWALVRRGTPRERVVRALLAGAPTLVAWAGWSAHLRRLGESARGYGAGAGMSATLRALGETLVGWLVPLPALPLRPLIAVALLAWLGWMVREALGPRPSALGRVDASEPGRLLVALLFVAGATIAVAVAASLVADASLVWDFERVLAPATFALDLALVLALVLVLPRAEGRGRTATAAALLALLLLLLRLPVTIAGARLTREQGRYFADARWTNAGTMRWATGAGRAYPLWSNFPALVWLHSGRPAIEIPNTADAATLRAFADTLVRRRGAVVLFSAPARWLAPPESLARYVPLRVVERHPEGVVLLPVDVP